MAVAAGPSGCRPEPTTRPLLRTVSSDADAWSGATLVLRSGWFLGPDTLPLVTVGSDTLVMRTFGRDSVAVVLPDTNGPITLHVRFNTDAGVVPAGPVRVHGFASAAVSRWSVDGSLLPWPGGAVPTAAAYVGGRLVLLDLTSLDGVPAPLIPDTGLGAACGHGPMPSAADPGLVVISHAIPPASCGPLIAVLLAAGAPAPDTGPPAYEHFPSVHLGRGRWLIDYKQHVAVVTGSPSAGFTTGPYILCAQPWGFAVSPRGDRVAPRGCYVPAPNPGLPVFDAASGAVAYWLPSLEQADEAAFSESGDTLFRAGSTVGAGRRVEALDATTGALLASSALEPAGWAMTLDRERPWLYVAGPVGTRPVVQVFDRRSLTPVATLRVPDSALDTTYYYSMDDYVTVLSPVERSLYLTIRRLGGTWPIQVLRFDLMP